MVQRCLWTTTALLVASLTTGCLPANFHRTAEHVAEVHPVLPTVARDDSGANPELVSPPNVTSKLAGTAEDNAQYRALDAQTCHLLAAKNSAAAHVIEAKKNHIKASRGHAWQGQHPNSIRALVEASLEFEELEARNLSSGVALQVFYRLAQAEAQLALVRESRAEVDAAFQDAESQRLRGLAVQQLHAELQRQQNELQRQHVDLGEVISRLNIELKGLLSLETGEEDWRIWPAISWATHDEIPEHSSALSFAFQHRPQLQHLRLVIERFNRRTMFMANEMFKVVSPLLSIKTPQLAVKQLFCPTGEVEAIRAQLVQLLEWRQKTIDKDVRQGIEEIEASLVRVKIAHDAYFLRKKELDHLQTQARAGLVANQELSTSKLELLKAKGQWIEQVVLWNLAHVRLRQAQGAFVNY